MQKEIKMCASINSVSASFTTPDGSKRVPLTNISNITSKKSSAFIPIQAYVFGVQDGKRSPIRPTVHSPCHLDIQYAGKEVLSPGKTLYISGKELNSLKLHGSFSDGEYFLRSFDGKLSSTIVLKSKNGNDLAAYAMDSHSRLYIHEHKSRVQVDGNDDFFYHSSFFNGGSGKCFGMIKIVDGKITYIDNHSGHYQPTKEHFDDIQERLKVYFHPEIEINYFESDLVDGAAADGFGDTLGMMFG